MKIKHERRLEIVPMEFRDCISGDITYGYVADNGIDRFYFNRPEPLPNPQTHPIYSLFAFINCLKERNSEMVELELQLCIEGKHGLFFGTRYFEYAEISAILNFFQSLRLTSAV